MRKTKQLFFFLATILLVAACQPTATTEEWPQDIAGKKALISSKKAAIKTLNADIEKLQSEVEELSPVKEKTRKLVTAKKIALQDFERFVEIQSSIKSDNVVLATSETGGRLLSVKPSEGQYVKKGQVLATVDLEGVNKQIAELEKSLELAVDVYERQKRLWDKNIGSEIQYLQAKNNKERLEKSMETVRYQLTKANVYAPISGVVDRVFLKTGELAGPGAPIVQILNTSKVKVEANVPEVYLKVLKVGKKVRITIPALDQEREGRISLLGTSINPANRTLAVEVELSNRNGLLKPNLLANMYISDYAEEDVVLIPLETVQQEVSGKSYVFVVGEGPDGKLAEKKYIKTGESYQGEIIITEGLKGGEQLILEGARGLTANELIKVENTSTTSNG